MYPVDAGVGVGALEGPARHAPTALKAFSSRLGTVNADTDDPHRISLMPSIMRVGSPRPHDFDDGRLQVREELLHLRVAGRKHEYDA